MQALCEDERCNILLFLPLQDIFNASLCDKSTHMLVHSKVLHDKDRRDRWDYGAMIRRIMSSAAPLHHVFTWIERYSMYGLSYSDGLDLFDHAWNKCERDGLVEVLFKYNKNMHGISMENICFRLLRTVDQRRISHMEWLLQNDVFTHFRHSKSEYVPMHKKLIKIFDNSQWGALSTIEGIKQNPLIAWSYVYDMISVYALYKNAEDVFVFMVNHGLVNLGALHEVRKVIHDKDLVDAYSCLYEKGILDMSFFEAITCGPRTTRYYFENVLSGQQFNLTDYMHSVSSEVKTVIQTYHLEQMMTVDEYLNEQNAQLKVICADEEQRRILEFYTVQQELKTCSDLDDDTFYIEESDDDESSLKRIRDYECEDETAGKKRKTDLESIQSVTPTDTNE
jgi:hypothetical protein